MQTRTGRRRTLPSGKRLVTVWVRTLHQESSVLSVELRICCLYGYNIPELPYVSLVNNTLWLECSSEGIRPAISTCRGAFTVQWMEDERSGCRSATTYQSFVVETMISWCLSDWRWVGHCSGLYIPVYVTDKNQYIIPGKSEKISTPPWKEKSWPCKLGVSLNIMLYLTFIYLCSWMWYSVFR